MAHVCQLFKSEQDTPKGFLTVSNIDQLVDNSSWFKLLFIMDAYLRYNHMPMDLLGWNKTTFINFIFIFSDLIY